MAPQINENDEDNEALIIHEIGTQTRICFNRRARHLGLTRSQWRVLSIARRNPGIRQSRIACMMEIEPITLGRLLDRMQKSGWIERKEDPKDRRVNSILLTDKARDILSQMRPIALDVRRDALKGFTAEEYTTLLTYLKRMKTNVTTMLSTEGEDLCAAKE